MTTITNNNIHVEDSSLLTKKEFSTRLRDFRLYKGGTCDVLVHRCDWSLKYEWATHKALYRLHIERDRTLSVDLDWPQPWYVNWAYNVIGFLVWIFV